MQLTSLNILERISLKVKGHLSSVLQIAGELLVINNKAFFTIEPNIVLGA